MRQKKQIAIRNARLSMVEIFLGNVAFILPIWLIYSINVLGYSSTISVVLFMSIWFTSGVLEIPTGGFADVLGRKKTFIIGAFLLTFYPIAYIVNPPLYVFLGLNIISGLGQALLSGSFVPMVHSAYEKAGMGKKAYQKYLARNNTMIFIARIIGSLTGAALYWVEPTLPFVAMFIVGVARLMIGCMAVDTTTYDESRVLVSSHIATAFSKLFSVPGMIYLTASYSIIALGAESLWTAYQVLFESDGLNEMVIGMVFALIAVFSALGSQAVGRLYGRLSPMVMIYCFGLTIVITAGLLMQPLVWLRVAGVIPMALSGGAIFLVLTGYVQQQVENRYHSTALSVLSFIQYCIYGLGLISAGVLLDLLGVDEYRRAVWIFGMFALAVVAMITYRQKFLFAQRISIES